VARYRYAGPGPQETPEGGIVRPGDEQEFAEEPVYGPWELLGGVPAKPDDSGGQGGDSSGGAQAPATPPATPPAATPPASPATASPATASPAAAAATSAPVPKTGM
jgi:hypothetical protein